MRKTEAFNSLGYPYRATRGSAELDNAVLMTLWQREIGWMPGRDGGTLYVDLEEIHPSGSAKREDLIADPKLRTRANRLRRALEDPSVRLDVVILFGPVGNESGEALPWRPEDHEMRHWRVVRVDPATNFFRMEANKSSKVGRWPSS